MRSKRYLALLRGINVGGTNVIAMAALRACFEDMGCTDVATYIQSGNVVFSTPLSGEAMLERTIEEALSERFKYRSRVVLVTPAVLRRVVKEAPKGFGANPDAYRYDVIFVKAPLTPQRALKAMEPGLEWTRSRLGDTSSMPLGSSARRRKAG